MSKHWYSQYVDGTENDYLRLEMGWDKKTQIYYCNIWYATLVGDSYITKDDPVYTFLSEPLGQTLEHFLDVCFDHNVHYPVRMVLAVEEDRKENRVGEVRHWKMEF